MPLGIFPAYLEAVASLRAGALPGAAVSAGGRTVAVCIVAFGARRSAVPDVVLSTCGVVPPTGSDGSMTTATVTTSDDARASAPIFVPPAIRVVATA